MKRTKAKSHKLYSIIAIASVLMVFMLSGVLAYLKDTEEVTNVFTIGEVNIELIEKTTGDALYSTITNDDITVGSDTVKGIANLVPGQEISKRPYVKNTGKNNAYVYMKVAVPQASINGRLTELFSYTLNSGWTLVETSQETLDNISYNVYKYQYDNSLAPNGETTTIFDTVILVDTDLTPADLENIQDVQKIDINAYAIQTEGLTLSEGYEIFFPDTNIATFLPGTEFNSKMKKLSSGADANVDSTDTLITTLQYSDTIVEENKTEDNLVSTQDSLYPIYIWYENGIIYWWSEYKYPYINSNARMMFANCSNLNNINFSNFNTRKMQDVSGLFYNCFNLSNVDFRNFNTRNVKDMSFMFANCNSLNELNLSNFDTSEVTNMMAMFNNCDALTSLDLSNFNTSKVTNMMAMFCASDNLANLNISNFNTSSVENMASMFDGCLGFRAELELNMFDTSNVTDMNRMFYNCFYLKELDISSFNTAKVTNMNEMFNQVRNLETIYVSSDFVTTALGSQPRVFGNCIKLKGGQGTSYTSGYFGKDYAHIDGGESNPGFFTDISDKPNS